MAKRGVAPMVMIMVSVMLAPTFVGWSMPRVHPRPRTVVSAANGQTVFDRDGLVKVMNAIFSQSTTKIHLLTGPRSCGKTLMVNAVLKEHPFTLSVSIRSMDTLSEEKFMQAFRAAFEEAAEKTKGFFQKLQPSSSTLASAVTGMLASILPEPLASIVSPPGQSVVQNIIDELRGVALTSNDPWKQIAKAIETIKNHKGTFIIHIDELNLLQSKGDPDMVWMDRFVTKLTSFLIQETKVKKRACAILETSDQQYAAQFQGKPDFVIHCLGYMSEKNVYAFLQTTWDQNEPNVTEGADRQMIVETVGGFFPDIPDLRRAAKRGKLQAAIYDLRRQALQNAISKGLEDGGTWRKAMRKLAPSLVEPGYITRAEAKKKIGKRKLQGLIERNLVQVRYGGTCDSDIWAPDLPAIASEDIVITAYLPIDRTWLREFDLHFPSRSKGLLRQLLSWIR